MSARTLVRHAMVCAHFCMTLAGFAVAQESGCTDFVLVDGDHPRATLRLNGKSLCLVVDTGATVTAVDAHLREALGEKLGQIDVSSNVSSSVATRHVCPEGTIGNFSLGLPSIVCLNFGEDLVSDGVDGVLGMDFLRHYCVDFDPDAGLLRLSKHMPAEVTGERTKISMTYNDGNLPIVVAGVDRSVYLRLTVDTGSISTVSLSPADEEKVFPNGYGRSIPAGSFSIHGTSRYKCTRMPSLALGEFISRNILCNVGKSATANTSVGIEFISRYRALFDFPNDTLTLVRRKKPYRNDGNMTGMHFCRNGGKCIIKEVDADSPASRSGLQAADELLAIDGMPLSDLRRAAIWKLLSSGDGKVVRLRVKDSNAERTVDLTLRRRI